MLFSYRLPDNGKVAARISSSSRAYCCRPASWLVKTAFDTHPRSYFKFVRRDIHELQWYLHTRVSSTVLSANLLIVYSLSLTPKSLSQSWIRWWISARTFLWDGRQILSHACALCSPGQTSFQTLQEKITDALRHVGWIARRTTMPDSDIFCSARRDNVSFITSRTLPFVLFFHGYPGVSYLFIRSNFHHEHMFVVTKNDPQGDVFRGVFLVGYWLDSRAVFVVVYANSWCGGLHVYVL